MKKKILVVDDNRMMLSFMINLLEKEGHEVAVAEDGISALDLITAFTPDVMFIDLILPRISGDLLCRIIRKMQHMKNTYLVVLSGALAEVGCDLTGIDADTFIAKGPFEQMAHHVLSTIKEADRPENDRHLSQILGLEGVSPRQMTKELILRKRHLEAMLESISEGVLEISSERIVYANSAAIAITGIPVEELLNSNPLNIFDDTARPGIAEVLNSNGTPLQENGTRKPVELNNRLVTLKLLPIKEVSSGSIMLITDVTVRTQMETELRHARKMEAIGTIASGVAHNFRNTLASIMANSQIVQMKYRNDEKLSEIVDRINSSVKKGEQLVNQLLEFSYKEIKKAFQPVDLVSLIKGMEQLLQVSFDKNIVIHTSVPESLYVLGDQSGLSTVLINLCHNARYSMPEGGTLSINAGQEGQKAVITIADTGRGMDSEVLEKCFDPFFTTREIGKGTGLGLSTAYGIIKKHNGSISVKSRPNKGSVFRIVLPLPKADEMVFQTDTVEKDPEFKAPLSKGERILIVDDEEILVEALSQLIETLGYRTATALNGADGIEIYKRLHPDIVLMDIGMPQMNGITCAKEILNYDRQACIVIMSGHEEDGPFGIKGADKELFKGYVTKPIDLENLSRLLERLYS